MTLLPETDPGMAHIGIRWHTGAHERIRVPRVTHPGTAKRSPSPAVDIIRELGPTTPTRELADILNARGITTGTGRQYDTKAVQWIRHAYRIPAPTAYAANEISVADAAARLGCSTGVLYYWIDNALLHARRGSGNRLCITWTEQIEAACRARIAASTHLNQPAN